MNYTERDFEQHIETHLLKTGYFKKLPSDYNKDLCLIPDDVINFIRDTQLDKFKRLEIQYGVDTTEKLLQNISKEINRHGTLSVLREGVKDRGEYLKLAYYKPQSGNNPEHHDLYHKNRFTIIRQLRYSNKNETSIDIVLFLNGLPIITAELKNSLTGQSVEDAIKQYKKDRNPKEPLLEFKRCLVHFAVGNELVYMTTKLQGDKTLFLPFNKNTENPVNPKGHKTSYLWEDILQPDTLLTLINHYLHKNEGGDKFIFPRYHQFDCVRKILASLISDGVGKNYLIQHSAGSGKSNSIAWLSHQLACFYQKPTDKDRLFDSIIVVTDRKILDRQLQNTIKQFEQTAGVVNGIDKNSAQLQKALEHSRDIIITTLQKFPVISESTSRIKGKRQNASIVCIVLSSIATTLRKFFVMSWDNIQDFSHYTAPHRF